MARTVVVVATVVLMLVAAPSAFASRTQLSVMEDDHLLLYSDAATRENALDQMQRLGVTTVHALVIWRRLAPAPGSSKRPVFDASDPAAYAGWEPYDALVEGALTRGMKVLFTPTAPMPDWASECGRGAARRWICKPRVSDYADFVHALGERYPQVDAWSLWNEPNHKSWLVPQSAQRYRQLASAGLAALTATGHGGDLRLIGETAPGGGRNSTAPVDFMREVFCLDPAGRPYTGRAARSRGCARRPHFTVGGISDHPYTSGAIGSPSAFRGRRGDAPIASVDRLVSLLDRAARFGIVAGRASVYLTEFGFQTRPPDRFGLSLARQAAYMNEADYMAFSNPRIASVAQYELRDDARVAVWNTGLLFADGRPKPALRAYAIPIHVRHTGRGQVSIFGLVRAARGSAVRVAIEHRGGGRSTFRPVARVMTNRWGYLLVHMRDLRGRWRLVAGSGADARYSRVAT